MGKLRTYMNLMITMLLGGLWHGANWTFVAWGGMHGFYLWVEKFLRDRKERSIGQGSLGDEVPAAHRIPEMTSMAVTKASMAPGFASGKKVSPGFIYALLTFLLVSLSWVFFRSPTFSGAGKLLMSMFGRAHGAGPILTTLAIIKVSSIVSLMLLFHWLMRNTRVLDLAQRLPWWVTGIAWSAIADLTDPEPGKRQFFYLFSVLRTGDATFLG